ncbi:WD repeat-containing protein 26 [Quillaja saponaria]|uniref:WD repeat-containing protein 26 n=1 Tax=Quillaja saponaria TaxID=32244 RepID=A0AAD7VEG8_QUISA|nr:WD repeat-containing protein 26 [Quillaja saponaria]
MDDIIVRALRKKLLTELEKLLPPPIALLERRLEHLVESTVTAWTDSCMYHSSLDAISLYEDHCCGRDQIPTETTQILTEHKNEVRFEQFSNNGEYLASSSSDCTAIVWKVLKDGKLTLKHTLSSHQNPVSSVAWSPDDSILLTCGNAEVLKPWDVETGICKHTFGNHAFIISSCDWFPDSKQLVCGSSDPEKGICMWDCDGNEIKAWRGMGMPKVLDLAVTPDGEYLISIFMHKEIRILNMRTNAERVIPEEYPITSLLISGDSKFFIVNLNSQEIHMWDIEGKWEKPLRYAGHKQHNHVIRSCFGGLNSTFIASGSENSQVYI